jgi:hypothetical protein
MENRVLEFETSSATVELAAKAVGCEPCRIAKTLSFMLNEKPILIVTAISREFYGKMLLALKLCLNPKKKNRQKFNIYADLLIKELPLESSSIKNIRIYKLLKKHLYFIVWLLLGRQI